MLPLLQKYAALQRLDLALRGVRAALDAVPGKQAGLQEQARAARVPLQQHREAVLAAEKRARTIERDLADLTEKKKKEHGRTFSVKTQAELDALNREVEKLAGDIARAEEEGLAALDAAEELARQTAPLQAAEQAALKDVAAAEAALADEANKLAGELARLETERVTADAQLDEEEREEYLRVAAHRDGIVVCRLQRDKFLCDGCRGKVRPQLVEEVFNGRLVRCESCQRFLYDEIADNSAPAA